MCVQYSKILVLLNLHFMIFLYTLRYKYFLLSPTAQYYNRTFRIDLAQVNLVFIINTYLEMGEEMEVADWLDLSDVLIGKTLQ